MKNFFAVLMAAFGLSFGSCAHHDSIVSVGADDFEKDVKGGKLQLVDVRTAEEYAEGHIAGAVNIDVMRSDFRDRAVASLDRGKTVYVYCRSGKRSMTAASVLAGEGFRVVNLSGGIMEWMDSGKAVSR